MISLQTLSSLCGWIYVFCWGISLYPPLLLNYRTKSVEGLSLDFAYLNFWGCTFYLFSVSLLYFSTTVRLEYALAQEASSRTAKGAIKQPLVQFNDVIYGIHSLILVIILLSQFYLFGYKKSPNQKLSKPVKVLSVAGAIGTLMLLVRIYELNPTREHYQLVDLANILGTCKVFLSTVKYLPQAYFNYQRKSLKGFAVKACISDIVGAVLCASQLLIDGYLRGDMASVLHHPSKLLLAAVTMTFGIIFFCQHRVYLEDEEPSLYNKNKGPKAA